MGVGDALQLPKEDLTGACGYFEHQRRVLFEGCVAEPLQTLTAILPGSKWSCWHLCIVLQDASSEITTSYPPLKLRVFWDEITGFLVEENKVVAETAKNVMKRPREEVGKNASNYQSMRKERKERAR